MKIEIKYRWSQKENDPSEVTSITMMAMHVPRVGEVVNIEVEIEKGEWVVKSGVVRAVTWWVKAMTTSVAIYIE